MSSHARKQIRDAVWQRLQNLPTTGDNVFRARATELTDDEVPGIVLIMAGESAEKDTVGSPGDGARIAELTVIAYAEAAGDGVNEDSIEDLLDQVAAEVETALLGADENLGGLVHHVELVGMRKEIGDGQQADGEMRLAFAIAYRTAPGAPTVILTPG